MQIDSLFKDFTLISKEEYISGNFEVYFYAYFEGILYSISKGIGQKDDIIKINETRDTIIRNARFDKKPFFEISDMNHEPRTSKEGRQLIIDNFTNDFTENCKTVIFTNLSPLMRVIIKTGIHFIANKNVFVTVKKNNADAIEFGLKMLHETEKRKKLFSKELKEETLCKYSYISYFDNLWKIKKEMISIGEESFRIIRNDEWVYSSRENRINIRIEVVETNIFIYRICGSFAISDIEHIVRLKNSISKLLGINRTGIINMVDCRGLIKEPLFSGSIKKYLSVKRSKPYLSKYYHLQDVFIFIHNSLIFSYFIRFFQNKKINRWICINDFENAFDLAKTLKYNMLPKENSKCKIPRKKSAKETLIRQQYQYIKQLKEQQRFETEEILKMISQLVWEKHNEPIIPENINCDSLSQIFQLLTVLFNDYRELFEKNQKSAMLLEEIDKLLKNEIIRREASETTLQSSHEKYKNIFYNIVDVYFELDLNGNIFEVSKSVVDILKYSRDEMIGNSIQDYLNNTQVEYMKLLKNQIIQYNRIRDFEVELIDKDKNIIPCYINANLVRNKSATLPNKIIGIIRMNSDKNQLFGEDLSNTNFRICN